MNDNHQLERSTSFHSTTELGVSVGMVGKSSYQHIFMLLPNLIVEMDFRLFIAVVIEVDSLCRRDSDIVVIRT